MNPEIVAAVFVTFTACAVAGYVLLIMQAGRYEAQKADLRFLLHRAAARANRAEALVTELCGDWDDPECTVLAASEETAFGDIADRLEVDMGLEILGDEGEAA